MESKLIRPWKENNIHYERKDHLEKIKRTLLEKVLRDLKSKYSSLFYDKNIDISYFEDKINKEIENFYNFNDPDYSKFFRKIENFVLKALSKVEDVRRENLMDKKKVEVIIEKENNDIENEISLNQNSKNGRNVLRSALKKREKDGWSKIVKNDTINFRREENEKLSKKKTQKIEYKNELDKIVTRNNENCNKKENQIDMVPNNPIFGIENGNKIISEKKNLKKIFELIIQENEKNQKLKQAHNEIIKNEENLQEIERLRKTVQEEQKFQEIQKEKKKLELELQDYLRRQIENKKNNKMNSNKFREEEKILIEKLVKEDNKRSEESISYGKNLKLAYKKDLDQQIKIKKDIPTMTRTEELLNKKLLIQN